MLGLITVLWVSVTAEFTVPMTIEDWEITNFHELVLQNSRNIALIRWPDERGHSFVVSRPIEKGLPVLVMDAEYVLTNFDTYPWSPYFEDAPPHIQLMARLIYEKYLSNADSLIHHYVGTLPLEYHLLVNFTSTDWQFMAKHRTFERGVTDLVDVQATYPVFEETIKNVTNSFEVLQLESWKWAYCTVLSRGFSFGKSQWKQLKGYPPVPADNFYDGMAISPFLDLPNHSPLPLVNKPENKNNVKPFILGSNPRGIYLLADRRFPTPGREFTYSYGNLTNLALLATYGFILDKNLDDTFPILTPVSVPCFGKKNENACEYTLQAYTLSDPLLAHAFHSISPDAVVPISVEGLSEYYKDLPRGEMTKNKVLSSLKTYRSLLRTVISDEFKQGLRVARKLLETAFAYREKLIIRYGIAEKVLVYEHLKLVDRRVMELVAQELNI